MFHFTWKGYCQYFKACMHGLLTLIQETTLTYITDIQCFLSNQRKVVEQSSMHVLPCTCKSLEVSIQAPCVLFTIPFTALGLVKNSLQLSNKVLKHGSFFCPHSLFPSILPHKTFNSFQENQPQDKQAISIHSFLLFIFQQKRNQTKKQAHTICSPS